MVSQYIFTALLLSAAAMFKAAADIMRNTYPNSIFARFNKPQFWDARKSFSNKRIFNYPLDGWHIANSLMIACFCSMGMFYQRIIVWGFAGYLVDLTIYAVFYSLVFNLFYDRILRK